MDGPRVTAERQVGAVKQRISGNYQVLLGCAQGLSLQDIVGKPSRILRVIERIKELRGEFQAFDFAHREYLFDLQIEVIDGPQRHSVPAAGGEGAVAGDDILRVGIIGDVGDGGRDAK